MPRNIVLMLELTFDAKHCSSTRRSFGNLHLIKSWRVHPKFLSSCDLCGWRHIFERLSWRNQEVGRSRQDFYHWRGGGHDEFFRDLTDSGDFFEAGRLLDLSSKKTRFQIEQWLCPEAEISPEQFLADWRRQWTALWNLTVHLLHHQSCSAE